MSFPLTNVTDATTGTVTKAEVAELADAADSKSVSSDGVSVQVRPSAPQHESCSIQRRDEQQGASENRPAGQAIGQEPGQREATPRAALLNALADAVRDAALAGDLHAARVAHEALGRLLVEPATSAVVDLSSERERRR